MPEALISRPAARVLVEQLLIHGVRRVFTVPGESFLPVLDALSDVRDRLPLIVCRQEGGAANMAEATGKLGDGPGVCFVTRGPGATNAAIGVHTAFQDSTPMLLFIGQVGTDFVGREAFQEVDYAAMFGPLAKRVIAIDRADRIPELVSNAFHAAVNGRPGPVVVVLPEDMLCETVAVADVPAFVPAVAAPSRDAMQRLSALLAQSRQPLLVLGGSRWTPEARDAVRAFAHAQQVPVACAFRFQDSYDNTDGHYAGDVGIGINPKLAARVAASDLLVVVGARLGEMTTSGYVHPRAPLPEQPLVHVLPDAAELGRVYHATLPVVAGAVEWALALADTRWGPVPAQRAAWLQQARDDLAAWRQPPAQPGAVDYPAIVQWLDGHLPDDAILTTGAGNFASPVHRLYRHRRHKTQVSPTSGAMGYGVPAAIACRLHHPQRTVVAFTGDGDFMMTAQELATAHQYRAPVIVVLVDNGMYGTIRMHQERDFPQRVYGTGLVNPDFVALAAALHAHAEQVHDTGAFAAAFGRAQQANRDGRSALLLLRIDPQALTINQTLQQIRQRALDARDRRQES